MLPLESPDITSPAAVNATHRAYFGLSTFYKVKVLLDMTIVKYLNLFTIQAVTTTLQYFS